MVVVQGGTWLWLKGERGCGTRGNVVVAQMGEHGCGATCRFHKHCHSLQDIRAIWYANWANVYYCKEIRLVVAQGGNMVVAQGGTWLWHKWGNRVVVLHVDFTSIATHFRT